MVGVSESSTAWAPDVIREQLQAFRSSDDLLSFFSELKDLVHVRHSPAQAANSARCMARAMIATACIFPLETTCQHCEQPKEEELQAVQDDSSWTLLHENHVEVWELSEVPEVLSYVALCCVVIMYRSLAERHVRPGVWLQRNTGGRDVEGGYHQSSALGQYLHRCCLDYEDLTLEVLPSPPHSHQ